MKAALLSSTLVAVALISGTTHAQETYPSPAPSLAPPFAYHHASTLEEGVLRGGADLMRGVGEMNYNNALALLHAQAAYSRAIENRFKQTATYFDMRKLNREARAEERGQRVTAEDAARYAKMRAPDRLAALHFDAARGLVVWPEVFNHSYFAEEREAIDRLMAERDGAGPEDRQIQALAARMTRKLEAIVRHMDPNEYGAAKRFVKGLQHEMNFAPVPMGVAAR